MAKSRILLSYAHRDSEWAKRLLMHLAPFMRSDIAQVSDAPIRAGDDWTKEIQRSINEADIVVLLVSADFLASDFINNFEIPRLLERHQQEGLVLVPVLLRPCAWQQVEWLSRIQVLPPDGRPLSEFSRPKMDMALVEVVKRIVELSEVITADKRSRARDTRPPGKPPHEKPKPKRSSTKKERPYVFISHESDDGYFAQVLKLTLEKEDIDAWMDVDRLRVGDDWRQEIDDAIRNALALIVVMSPLAKESEYVTYEWAFAWGAGVKVIPIMLKSTQLHPRLESLQHLDFTNRRASQWDDLIEELKNAHNGKNQEDDA